MNKPPKTKQQEILELLQSVEQRVRASGSKELADKIFFANAFKAIRKYVEEEKAAPIQVTEEVQPGVADVSAPVTSPTSIFERESAVELSNRLSHAFTQWQQLRDDVSPAIRAPDKRITTISTPARPNEELINTFDSTKGTLLLVVSTNSDAYMMTKNQEGVISVSSARYWKSKHSVAS